MAQAAAKMMTVEAELRAPVATAQLVRFHLEEPADNFLREEESFRLDLCLTPRPRNARACYREHWSPHRYERIGQVFLLPPRESMHTRSDDCGEQASLVCHLRPEPIRACFDAELKWSDRHLEAGLDIANANIRGLLLRLAEEARHPGFASELLVELVAAQLAIELGRYCAGITESSASGGLSPWRLRLIEERLREVRDAPTLAELARLCDLSVRQLTRGFRASRGCSIGDHVANSRVDHARRLLAADESVKAVAYSLGFSSPSSFCFAFRRATGETPRQFRHNAHTGQRAR